MARIHSAAALAALVFAALASAGCGGSNDAGSDAEGAKTTLNESATTTGSATDTATTTDTTASTGGASTDAASTEASPSPAGLSAECKDLAAAGEKYSAAIQSSTGSADTDLEASAKAYKKFAEQAPEEIRSEFEVLADVLVGYATAFKDINLKPGAVPNAEQLAKLTKLSQSFSSEKAQKASTAISAWVAANCSSSP